MAERFSDELRQAAAEIWEAQHAHPFVRGIGDGSLDTERFAYFIRQDYLYLVDYARLLSLGAARAPDLATMQRLAELSQEILVGEMELHRAYARRFGITEQELEAEAPTPTTQAYTDFLLRVTTIGDFAELAAALLPCMWGYSEVGQRLAAEGRPADDRYADWIDAYASAEFADQAAWCRTLVDRLAAPLGEEPRGRMTRAFLTSSRYELAFWQSAWDLEQWPV